MPPSNPHDLVRRLLEPQAPPFALLRRRGPGREDGATVDVLIGAVCEVERLADVPLPCGAPGDGNGAADALAVIPFRQIRERGFDARDDGTPLLLLRPDEVHEAALEALVAALPDLPVTVDGGSFDVGDDEYAGIVERVVADEIGRGEGANFVIRRTFTGELPGFGAATALSLYRRLLEGERGAYWTFLLHTAERTLVGASPEVHVRMTGGTVTMNPISGTYRYPAGGPTADDLLAFLDDPKEAEELTMVVDEELKMMCAVGDLGGQVVGPRLKEMAHLAHTEYELRGRSSWDVRDVLRETMFAATVTGSPVQNACRVIERHEPGGRGYYAGALALIGRDAGGAQTLDSPILIRTADIDANGGLRVPVGATLVRHSQPRAEVAETHAKAAGVLAALGVRPAGPRSEAPPRLGDDPRVRAALAERRAGLAPFWLKLHTGDRPGPLTGHAFVLDCEDTFTSMLAHLLRSTGLEVTVRRYDEPGAIEAARAHRGPVVLGPGPGDPADADDPKMALLRPLTRELLAEHGHGLLGVCLGHELMAAEMGMALVRKAVPFQGAQEEIDLFGVRETVGFYSTFTARCEDTGPAGVELSRHPVTGDVHAMRGAGFAGVQFHPESVLTLDGPGIVTRMLSGVLVG
ncbi:anthranilate synthase family protein [Wenjunlia tyrosinilytica]|uniref:anthranilate synthase n=1 Tax=Wenjunlia tyrosinilytica TaxID=1544741 RepID=A0A917ZEL7_9ACTN|nr:anthranilate synthase family protein [Wenjunlia tyrosinilytica]GGO81935.1 phenazine-specific anthranilate synthase component I [Wenjunlia tyrosinilytica]